MYVAKRELTPMKATTPDPNTIVCRDCAFRDKTIIKVGSKEKPVGVTRAECDMFIQPNFKPHDVLFDGANCRYHRSE